MRTGGQQPITWLIKPIKQAEKQFRGKAVFAVMAETAFFYSLGMVCEKNGFSWFQWFQLVSKKN
jgi:hypothetical protein